MSKLIELIIEMVKTKVVSLALAAFSIAIGLTAVIFFLLTFAAGQVNGKDASMIFRPLDVIYSLSLAAFLVIAFVVIWFFLFMQYSSEADDLYSTLREKLKGTWQVTYDLQGGLSGDPKKVPRPQVLCKIIINPTNKKLEMRFLIPSNHPVWRNDNPQVIRDISLRHDRDDEYVMTYYYSDARHLTNAVSELIEPILGRDPSILDIEICATLRFRLENSAVRSMKGQWFDLNGEITLLGALLDEVERGAPTPKALSSVHLTPNNFCARMGELEFEKIAADAD